MIRQTLLFAVLVVTLALWMTAHAMLTLGLLRRPRPWRAALAFVVVPLAPWWGWRNRMRLRSGLWIVAALVYILTLRAI